MTSTNLLKSDAVSNVSAASNADGEYTFAEYAHIFSFMTDEERKVAMYLLKKFGTDSVKDYFNVKLQEINSRDGLSEALKVLENLDSTSGEEIIQELIKLGITDGVGTFFEGLGNATGGIDGITSAHQFKIMYIASWLSEEDPSKLNYLSEEIKQAVIELRKIASEEVRKGAYEISSSIGNMLPAIAVSTASSIVLTPAGGNKLGAVLMGLSAGGNAAENMYQQGFSFQESVTYGVMSGSSEAALGYFLGKIPGLSKMDDIPGLKNFFSDMLSEGREEFYQAILDPCFKSIVTGTKLNINWNEAIKSGIYGMITAGIMNSGEMVVDSVTGVTIEVDSLSTETIETIALLEEAGVEVDYTRIPEVGYIESLTEFLDDDITELKLESATVADWANTWSEFELSDWIHDCFDNIFGSKVIDKYVLSRIHKLSVEDYVELCKQHETTPQKTLGFVDKQHNLYLPENASMHTACHESLHLVSELNKMFKGQIIYDSEGNPHKVTGILEYYQNALKSKMANESLTDYLSSKYSDGKKYNTAYVDYVGYWEKLDNVLFEVYGENGSDLLLNTYLSNDTTFLRSFFDTYAGEGSYDRFVLSMENEMSEMYKEMDLTYRLKEINNIMSTIEYNVYKENHPIAHKIKSIFGGK